MSLVFSVVQSLLFIGTIVDCLQFRCNQHLLGCSIDLYSFVQPIQNHMLSPFHKHFTPKLNHNLIWVQNQDPASLGPDSIPYYTETDAETNELRMELHCCTQYLKFGYSLLFLLGVSVTLRRRSLWKVEGIMSNVLTTFFKGRDHPPTQKHRKAGNGQIFNWNVH